MNQKLPHSWSCYEVSRIIELGVLAQYEYKINRVAKKVQVNNPGIQDC